MRNSAKVVLLAATIFLTGTTAFGQWLVAQKDLAFAQVAAGPGLETVLTLTNRGGHEYDAKISFSRGLNGSAWNPVVNGTPVTLGQLRFQIPTDQTVVLHVTGTNTVETGFAVIRAIDLYQDNFVEANLTYYFRQNGVITDSVGVSPSTEFYLTALPFEDFFAVALALANPSPNVAPTQVLITLIDGSDAREVTSTTISLGPQAHTAQFLSEIFPGISLGKGKVEIASVGPLSLPAPIVGTALTLVNGQISSLPLLPSPVAYNIALVGDAGSSIQRIDGTITPLGGRPFRQRLPCHQQSRQPDG